MGVWGVICIGFLPVWVGVWLFVCGGGYVYWCVYVYV